MDRGRIKSVGAEGSAECGALPMRPRGRALIRIVIAGGIVGALTACAPQVRNHGYVPTSEELSEIVVGVDTRASVEETVGTPSAAGVLDDAGYFYVRQQVRQYGWREPEVISREIVAISFDTAGVVSNVERFGLEDGNVVALSRRTTETNVQSVGFLRQLLGNVGAINTGGLTGGP
ncbi:MAG: outer membrane protein assembly factor BamE [Pseudomonadota bacterium]